MITAEQILAEADSWLLTPFHHRGLVKGVGVDCAHFLIGVFSAVGAFPLWQPEDYPPDWHLHRGEERFLGYLEQYANRVDDPHPGDVAMFRFGRCVSHGSIIVRWPRIIHAYIGQGVVYADANTSPKLRGRIDTFWRIKGIE